MVAFAQRILTFATRSLGFYNSAPTSTLIVVDPAQCPQAVLDALEELNGRGAMRITVSQ